MRHLRFAATLLLFVALPAFLALRGFDLYADFVTRAHHDEAFARQGRLLRELKDEINLGLEKRKIATEAARAFAALPDLSDDAVDALRGSIEARLPGLLRVLVFRRERAGDAPVKLVATGRAPMAKRMIHQAFATLLYSGQLNMESYHLLNNALTAEAELLLADRPDATSAGMRKMVERQVLSARLSMDFMFEQRDQIVDLTIDGRETALFWDLIVRPGDGGGPGGRRGVVIIYIDEKRYAELFDEAFFVERKNRDTPPPSIRFEMHRLTSEAALAPHIAREPALAGRLRATLGTALEAEGASRLVTWLPARETDQLFLVASTERDLLAGGVPTARSLVTFFVLIAALAAAALGASVQYAGYRPYLSVRMQLAALFGLASLLPLSVIFYMGLHYVRASEEVAARRLVEDLRARNLAVDEEERRIRGDLREAAVRLLDSPECRALADGLTRYEGRRSSEARIALAREFSEFTAAVALKMGPDQIFAYYIFDRSAEIMTTRRLDPWELTRGTGMQSGLLREKPQYYNETQFLSGMARAGVARFSGEEPEEQPIGSASGDSVSAFFIHNQIGLADRLFRTRRVIHTFDIFGHRIDMFFEPLNDSGGRVAGILALFYIGPFIDFFRVQRAVTSSHESRDGVRFYAGHNRLKASRLPSVDAFSGDLLAAFEKVAADRNPVETRTRVNGEEVLLVAQQLVAFRDYILIAVAPYARVRDEVARTLRLISTLLFLSVLVAAAIGLVISVKFIRPVRAFERGVAALTVGELDYRMAIDSNDELGELSGAFNRMIAGLQEKERMSRYVSESVRGAVKREAAEDADLGQERKATILFCDIRGFTALSEIHPPPLVVAMLNGYLEAMTAVVIRSGGVVDKFIGDAIMAVFYPDPTPGGRADEARAVTCALEMRSALESFNADRSIDGLFTIEIGIGVHTDEVIQGSIGSREHRVDLTVIGDGVNLAARLESLSKEGTHTKIILSERTCAAVRDLVAVVPLGARQVRGKELPVEVFEIVGPRRAADYLPALGSAEAAERVEAIRLLAVLGDRAALPGIVALLDDPEPRVRREATVALRAVGHGERQAVEAARAALARETEEGARATLVSLIGEIGDDGDRLALEPLLKDGSARIRANAIEALCRARDRVRLRAIFRNFLHDPNNRIRANACVTLFALGDAAAIDHLVAMARLAEPLMRASGAWGLGEIATRERIAQMRVASGTSTGTIPETLFLALDGALDTLHELLADPHPMVARNAARALGRVGNRRSAVALIRAFNDCRDDEVRSAILLALEAIGGANLIGKFTA